VIPTHHPSASLKSLYLRPLPGEQALQNGGIPLFGKER